MSVARINVAGLLAVNALVPVETVTDVLDPLPVVSLASLFGAHKPPPVTVSADGAEMHKLLTIFGRVSLTCRQPVSIQLEIPTTESFAAWAFHSAAICRLHTFVIHECIGMRVVHVLGRRICHHATIIAEHCILSTGKRNRAASCDTALKG